MSDIFGKFDTQDLNRKSALDIFEKLRPIRQGINKDFIARRLIWELIQNAKDNVAVCNSKSKQDVKVEITLTESEFVFSHNNGFFKNENIRGLIRRYSSSDKDRDSNSIEEPPSTTGRFGTGFMTTHLLSEKVDVRGVFQNDKSEFRNFELLLDRTGQNVPDLIIGIEKAFDSVEKSINSSTSINKPIEGFKSEFTYHLSKEGVLLSNISIEELKNTAAYSLVNHPNIQEIKCNTTTENFCFSINVIKTTTIDEIKIEVFELKINKDSENKHYVSISKAETKVIFPIKCNDKTFTLLPFEQEVPKLFLDFPLIGTEELHLPFVINSPFFEPTEQRDGISLTGGEDKDTEINSSIFKEAFELYYSFIAFIENNEEWKDLFHLANIRKPMDKDWIKSSWYEDNFLKPTREILLNKSIVDTVKNKRRSIVGEGIVDFPSGSTKEIREKIWELCNIDEYFILPIKEHIHEWSEIIWVKDYKLTLEVLVKWIQEKLNLEDLSKSLGKTINESILWLNEVLSLINEDELLLSRLNQDRIQILPNQNGVFKPKSKLNRDNGIDENLKNVMDVLGTDWRDFLLSQDISDFSGIIFNSKEQTEYFMKAEI
jgi:hypothetical protein